MFEVLCDLGISWEFCVRFSVAFFFGTTARANSPSTTSQSGILDETKNEGVFGDSIILLVLYNVDSDKWNGHIKAMQLLSHW